MHLSHSASAWRRAAACVAAVVIVTAAVAPTRAADTELADPSGVLRIAASGKWRTQDSPYSLAANGFLGGVKRAELFGVVYDDLKSADDAARRWKEARTKENADASYEHHGDTTRWTAHSASAGSVDYARALAGAGKAAVVWVRVSGSPGSGADDANALLDAAVLKAPEPEKPAEAGAGTGGKPSGATATAGSEQKDPDFRISVRLPDGFTVRKDVEAKAPRVISATGPVGSDAEAYLDVYLFDGFRRVDACGRWWQERARMGWVQGAHIEGDVAAFKVEVRDETWTRHVRIIDTEAGIVGLKLDAASQAAEAAVKTLDGLVGSLKVLKPRKDPPTAPPGMRSLENEKSVLQHELPGGDEAAKDFQLQADVVEDHVTELAGLPPEADHRAVLRVYADAAALANALRPLGIDDGRAAHWWIAEGAVLTHGGALATDEGKAAQRMELTRACLQRRLGFRAPFWVERGIGHLVASAVFNKGRVDQPHPSLVRSVADAAPTGVEFQTVRWWTHEDSATHPEREAIAWSYIHFFLHAGAVGRKYEPSYRAYMQALKASGDPVEAGDAFDFARETELAQDWQLWARKL